MLTVPALFIKFATVALILGKCTAVLVYPPNGGLVKLIMAVAMPVNLGTKQQMAFNHNFQYIYTQANNFTLIAGPYPPVFARKRRQVTGPSDRQLAYAAAEELLKKYGIKGRECLLRAICENAETSFDNGYNGMYGVLMHIFLTPDYGDNEVDEDLNPLYYQAQKDGESRIGCEKKYSDCPNKHNVVNMISILEF